MSNKLHWGAGDSPLFLPFFVCLQDTYYPNMCGFLSVWKFLLFFAHGPLLFASCVVSCRLAPVPLSLFICSYLPAVTQTELRGGVEVLSSSPLTPGPPRARDASWSFGFPSLHLYLPHSPPRDTVCANDIRDRSTFSKHHAKCKVEIPLSRAHINLMFHHSSRDHIGKIH